MRLLLTITDKDINEKPTGEDSSNFNHREAARAVVFNSKGRIPLLHVSKHGYHKLPGGGIDESEEIETALRRELIEELGCEIDSIKELGLVDEVHDQERLTQRSYCFTANITQQINQPNFTDEEKADGFEIVEAADIDKAIKLLTDDHTQNYVGKYILKRDLLLLNTVKGMMNEAL